MSLLFESCTLGLVFIRFSRPGKRALTVLFSDTATLAPLPLEAPAAASQQGQGQEAPLLALSFRITELTCVRRVMPDASVVCSSPPTPLFTQI